MTPYYFTGSAGMSMSIWMQSNDFIPKVGLTYSGSTTLLAQGLLNAWKYDSTYSCAAIHYGLPSSSIYKVECSSSGSTDTGSFKLYISQGATSSIYLGFYFGPSLLVYNTASQLIFAPSWAQSFPGDPEYTYDVKMNIINPLTNTVVSSSYTESNARMILDVIYNSIDNNMYIITTSGSNYIAISSTGTSSMFMDVWNSNGSVLLSSHSINLDFGGYGYQGVASAFNPDRNEILLSPFNFTNVLPLSYSIYDCNINSTVYSGSKTNQGRSVTYVSSSQQYYIAPFAVVGPADKVNASSYAITPSTISSSNTTLTYIEELDVIVGSGDAYNNSGSMYIHNATTEEIIAVVSGSLSVTIPYIYDRCKECIVAGDYFAGGTLTGGGLEYVRSGSWIPANFVRSNRPNSITYCDATSTIWVGTGEFNVNKVIAIISSAPTASFPQPPL